MADPGPGAPYLPYGRQDIDADDIAAVVAALQADLLTTGPRVEAFELAFAQAVGAKQAIACSNGTAALHLAMMALQIGEGDVCVVPAITFLATANCVRFVGAEVVFADVDPASGLMTPDALENALGRAAKRFPGRPVKAVLPVHLRGDVCDLPGLQAVAAAAGAVLVEDAPHALGSRTRFVTPGEGEAVGDCRYSAMATFSFHPVKTIATGEGGMVVTGNADLAARLRLLRSHGMRRPRPGLDVDPWWYEMGELGFNYRLPDILCALGHSQLSRLPQFAERRRHLSRLYAERLAKLNPLVAPAARPTWSDPVLHLLTVLIDFDTAGISRREVMRRLADRGIGSQVHYIPVNQQPYYRNRYGDEPLPGAEAWYARCLSLPLFPAMADDDVDRVVDALQSILMR